ncbi:MAG: TetR/AcrR family transcriptional regulator [Anaerolineae bacterium]|nr:TetR/AcrR family transcriptional regulator [Anaerolineae bacterium]
MPKPTFLNLPEEKRMAFTGIALDEFANHDYNTASVSKIVERAGIAKGSVYQYFDDKQDLFMYLLEIANREMIGFIQQATPSNPDADFFETLRGQMSATVQAAQRYPVHARLVRRAYTAPLPFHDEILEEGKKLRQEYFRAMIVQAQSSGHLSPRLAPAVVSFVVQGVINDLGLFLQSRFGESGDDWLELPEVGEVFDQVIEILRCGLEPKSGS